MVARVARLSMAILVAGLALLSGCETPEPVKPMVTYKCLSSSCDGTTTCAEGDPVPQHCGKPMIR